MTAVERQRRYRARKAGKPLPIDHTYIHKLVDAAFDQLARADLLQDANRLVEAGLSEDAARLNQWLDRWRWVLHKALDGQPHN